MATARSDNVAAAYLAQLADRGVEYLFGNAGTDFAPLIEAYAAAGQKGTAVPRPIIATHENLAVSMAHGYGMISRKIPAVMVHVSVGTANMVCGAMNAARENVAMLLTAGRTPINEAGVLGARDGYIHWAQEMYDQSGLLREIVKWDYELRNGEQLETVVDRALSIAATEPRGPVYLSLPREVLAARTPAASPRRQRMHAPASAAPDPEAITAAAKLLANAKRPLVIATNAGRDPATFAALARCSERFALPVAQSTPRYLSLPSSHPMNVGFEPSKLVPDRDVILVLDSDVPWIPAHGAPPQTCKVIQCGHDPLHTQIPIRGFACDIGITGGTAQIIGALEIALDETIDEAVVARRRKEVVALRAARDEEAKRTRATAADRYPIDPIWASQCLERAKSRNTIVVNEYTLRLDHCDFDEPDCYFGSSSASGLGWGAGAALGAKLAAPDREVVAMLGDGAYLFANPVAVHHAAAMHELPVLFIVMNNSMWNAVRRFTVAMYPGGKAAKRNDPAFVHLDKLPAFEEVCRSAGGWGERVEDPAALPAAIERALQVVRTEKRQALLNVSCAAY